MMSNSELYTRIRAAMVLAMMALSMAVLPACSSTEESGDSPPPCEEGQPGYPDCKL